jgi:hypothetical protein
MAECPRGPFKLILGVLIVAILRNHQGIFARTEATKNALKERGRMKSGGAKEKSPRGTWRG